MMADCEHKRCSKKALKIGLSVSFVVTAAVSVIAPDYTHVVVVAGAGQNLVWLWEV